MKSQSLTKHLTTPQSPQNPCTDEQEEVMMDRGELRMFNLLAEAIEAL